MEQYRTLSSGGKIWFKSLHVYITLSLQKSCFFDFNHYSKFIEALLLCEPLQPYSMGNTVGTIGLVIITNFFCFRASIGYFSFLLPSRNENLAHFVKRTLGTKLTHLPLSVYLPSTSTFMCHLCWPSIR